MRKEVERSDENESVEDCKRQSKNYNDWVVENQKIFN